MSSRYVVMTARNIIRMSGPAEVASAKNSVIWARNRIRVAAQVTERPESEAAARDAPGCIVSICQNCCDGLVCDGDRCRTDGTRRHTPFPRW